MSGGLNDAGPLATGDTDPAVRKARLISHAVQEAPNQW
jgi:hypothetical protein